MRICGISGCKESHNRILHRDKLLKKNNEEDEKKTEASFITEREQAKSDLIKRQCMLQNN